MARQAACPKCRNQFTLPELTGPATIACPFCGAHIHVKLKSAAPPPAMVVQQTMTAAKAIPVEDDEDEQVQQRPRKNQKKGTKNVPSGSSETGMKIAIVGGILLLTVISIIFAFWWFLRGDGRQKIEIPVTTITSNSGQ